MLIYFNVVLRTFLNLAASAVQQFRHCPQQRHLSTSAFVVRVVQVSEPEEHSSNATCFVQIDLEIESPSNLTLQLKYAPQINLFFQ